MNRNSTPSRRLALLLAMLSLPVLAVEPMSEEAMGSMALESGQNFIQVYGPTSAGLSIDIDDSSENSSSNKENEAEISATVQTISDLEKQLIEEFEASKANGDFNIGQARISQGDSLIVGQASSFDTTSEIRYKDGAFKHESKFNKDGSVKHTRDLQIDMLKFENIGGDDLNNSTTIGDIYISDWSSRGSNTTTER